LYGLLETPPIRHLPSGPADSTLTSRPLLFLDPVPTLLSSLLRRPHQNLYSIADVYITAIWRAIAPSSSSLFSPPQSWPLHCFRTERGIHSRSLPVWALKKTLQIGAIGPPSPARPRLTPAKTLISPGVVPSFCLLRPFFFPTPFEEWCKPLSLLRSKTA